MGLFCYGLVTFSLLNWPKDDNILFFIFFMFKMIIFGWINEKILEGVDGRGTSMIRVYITNS